MDIGAPVQERAKWKGLKQSPFSLILILIIKNASLFLSAHESLSVWQAQSDSLRSHRPPSAVYRLSAANKTALHYDEDLISVNSLHMEDNRPQWDLCQPECETSDTRTL